MVLVNTDAASTAARALATCAMLGMVALGSRGFATLTVHGGVGSGVGMWHEFWMGSPLGITYPEACPAPRDWSPRPTHGPTSRRTVQRPRSRSSKPGFVSYKLGFHTLCQRRVVFQELIREDWRPPPAVVARRSTQPESEPAVSEFGDTLHG